jgi:hypothetical protein
MSMMTAPPAALTAPPRVNTAKSPLPPRMTTLNPSSPR